MCGIAGQFKYNTSSDRDLVERMTRALIHRGPDGEGYYVAGPIGLGMRRLSIIDLVTGDQPIRNEDGSVQVVFNGEIYNYRDLRTELERAGHRFYTNSDTETIVHAFEEYGEEFVNRLEGMFAIALWDGKRQRLLLARDRTGEKPLYYRATDNEIRFASELKALLVDREIPRTIDEEALHHYLVFGRVPAPLSIIAGIKKLTPASLLIAAAGQVAIRRYWQPSFARKSDATPAELAVALKDKLSSAVKRMMVSDVPLGAFLSGGVDSSAVVAMMAQHASGPVKTFSIGFPDADFSELKYAKQVSELFSTDHREFIIEPDVIGIVPKLAAFLDEPFADFSAIPTYYVAEATRRHVTVALTGDGGDELFAGYEWYKAIKLARAYNVLPRSLRRGLYQLSKLLPSVDDRDSVLRYLHKLKRFARTQAIGSRNPLDILLNMTAGFTEGSLRRELYTDAFRTRTEAMHAKHLRREQYNEYDGDNIFEAVLYGQFASLLPDLFFTKVDRMSMAVSLETRAPMLDRELVEFAATIPFGYKLHGQETKWILKEALRGLLPDNILFRPKKGFSLPLHRWLREGPVADTVAATLKDPSFSALGYFKPRTVSWLLKEHREGKENNVEKIWRLYMFALWYREYMK